MRVKNGDLKLQDEDLLLIKRRRGGLSFKFLSNAAHHTLIPSEVKLYSDLFLLSPRAPDTSDNAVEVLLIKSVVGLGGHAMHKD